MPAPVTNVIENDYFAHPGQLPTAPYLVNEQPSGCLPGAFARSLEYLFQSLGGIKKNQLIPSQGGNQPASAQDIYNALQSIMGQNDGTRTDAQRIKLKNDWVNLILKNNFPGFSLSTTVFDVLGGQAALPGVTPMSGTDVQQFIDNELSKPMPGAGEDVELTYVYQNADGTWGAHMINVQGIYTQGGMTYLKYREDGTQNGTNNDQGAKMGGKLAPVYNGAGQLTGYTFNGNAVN
jgi:hypothetical protein